MTTVNERPSIRHHTPHHSQPRGLGRSNPSSPQGPRVVASWAQSVASSARRAFCISHLSFGPRWCRHRRLGCVSAGLRPACILRATLAKPRDPAGCTLGWLDDLFRGHLVMSLLGSLRNSPEPPTPTWVAHSLKGRHLPDRPEPLSKNAPVVYRAAIRYTRKS